MRSFSEEFNAMMEMVILSEIAESRPAYERGLDEMVRITGSDLLGDELAEEIRWAGIARRLMKEDTYKTARLLASALLRLAKIEAAKGLPSADDNG